MTTHNVSATGRRIDWPVVAFFAIAYALAWSTLALTGAIARQAGLPLDDLLANVEALRFDALPDRLAVSPWLVYGLTRLQDWAFTIAGLILIGITAGAAGFRTLGGRLTRWRVGARWYLVALLPYLFYLIAVLVAGLSDPAVFASLDVSAAAVGAILFGASGFFMTLLTRGPMGEEPGLRGFALPRLQRQHSSFGAAAIIGVAWAAWHLPVLLGRDLVSQIAFLLAAFGLSFAFTWLFNHTRGSLIPVLIFHTAVNTEDIFEILFPALVGTDWELISTLLLLLFGLAIGIVLWRRRRKESAGD